MISFTAFGTPVPQGSKRPMKNKWTGRAMAVDTNRDSLMSWRGVVSGAAGAMMVGKQLFKGPVFVAYRFRCTRPKDHYGTGRNEHVLKLSAPKFISTGSIGDADKLERAINDAMTGVVFVDDRQVSMQFSVREFSDRSGCDVAVFGAEEYDDYRKHILEKMIPERVL